MINFRIGNWLIDETGINYTPRDYSIGKDELLKSEYEDEIFDWPIHLATKTWMTKEDLYAFNSAFIYAIEAYNLKKPLNMSFVKTFFEQDVLFKSIQKNNLTK